MSDFDTAAWLSSVLGHLNQHPDLNGTVMALDGCVTRIHVGGGSASELLCLVAWARTLDQPAAVTVTAVPGDGNPYTHLRVTGRLADGTKVLLVACLRVDESDLLAANTVVAEDAAFPVELLYRLDGRLEEAAQ